jgi:hypothetical protein
MIADKLQTLDRPRGESRSRDYQLFFVVPDVSGLRTIMVNLYFVGWPGSSAGWVLVDTGLPLFKERIRHMG